MIDAAAGRITVDDQEIVAARAASPQRQAGEICARWRCGPRRSSLERHRAGDGRNRLHGTIEEVSFLGSVVRIRVRFGENAISLDTFNNPGAAAAGARRRRSTVSFAPEDVLVLEGAEAA